jgi:hypothetical protein
MAHANVIWVRGSNRSGRVIHHVTPIVQTMPKTKTPMMPQATLPPVDVSGVSSALGRAIASRTENPIVAMCAGFNRNQR